MENKNIKEILSNKTKTEPITKAKLEPITESKKVEETTQSDIPQWAKELLEKVDILSAENKMLKDMAGTNAVQSYVDGNKPKESKKAHFKMWNGKIVIGWGQLDYSMFNPAAKDGLRENILTELIFSDGTKEKVNYVQFNTATDVTFLEIVKQIGDLTTVVLPDGSELTVETKFLNR